MELKCIFSVKVWGTFVYCWWWEHSITWRLQCVPLSTGARIITLTRIDLRQSTLEYPALEGLNPWEIRQFSFLSISKISSGIIGPIDNLIEVSSAFVYLQWKRYQIWWRNSSKSDLKVAFLWKYLANLPLASMQTMILETNISLCMSSTLVSF